MDLRRATSPRPALGGRGGGRGGRDETCVHGMNLVNLVPAVNQVFESRRFAGTLRFDLTIANAQACATRFLTTRNTRRSPN